MMRTEALKLWVADYLQTNDFIFSPIINDASFRKFFRVMGNNKKFIAIDAPPDKEDSTAFVMIARAFLAAQLPVPEIFVADVNHGFLLVSDLGAKQLFQVINSQTATQYYSMAIDLIMKIQKIQVVPEFNLPVFNEKFIRDELSLFQHWFLQRYLNYSLTEKEANLLLEIENLCVQNALEQPQVLIHRDFHSKNLLLSETNELGIVDFQGAMFGPISYDLVSLLKDCYLIWPKKDVEIWLNYYFECNQAEFCFSKFLRWFDIMGLQRHLKVLGSFSRSYLRDAKPQYLQEIPKILHYIDTVINSYEKCHVFKDFFHKIKMKLKL